MKIVLLVLALIIALIFLSAGLIFACAAIYVWEQDVDIYEKKDK